MTVNKMSLDQLLIEPNLVVPEQMLLDQNPSEQKVLETCHGGEHVSRSSVIITKFVWSVVGKIVIRPKFNSTKGA
jgi:hypothetical protein